MLEKNLWKIIWFSFLVFNEMCMWVHVFCYWFFSYTIWKIMASLFPPQKMGVLPVCRGRRAVFGRRLAGLSAVLESRPGYRIHPGGTQAQCSWRSCCTRTPGFPSRSEVFRSAGSGFLWPSFPARGCWKRHPCPVNVNKQLIIVPWTGSASADQ